ncbi:MAG: ABC-F family ATP-binding cassette domain-containing protein [Lachnospiraceae bacterium]|nr:ABC-F family ATP-binding cassette domain-containing protein [Lachnospiraceae bacterium]
MNLLTMEHITKSYTERLLFDNASFSLGTGEKVGLIGINGTGKSTLLKMIAGLCEPDQGSVVRGNGLTFCYLPQTPAFDGTKSVLASVLSGLSESFDSSEHSGVSGSVWSRGVPERSGRAWNTGEVREKEHWDLESQAKAMLNTLGMPDFLQPMGELSGGQRKRAALAAALLSEADILVLDEPTNHLDSGMAGWLEEYLKRYKGALVMVTHDRYFLDSVCNRIVELSRGKLYGYPGGYSEFLELKAERENMAQASERKRQSLLRKELLWMMRGARARSTKQKAHIRRYEELRDRKGPEVDETITLGSVKSRLGKTTVELHDLSKAYGEKRLIRDFSYTFLKNDRVGISGPNGCGKSTLMKLIMGICTADSGEVVLGQTVKLGYFSQENESMDQSLKVIDYIRNVAEYVTTEDGSVSASKMLERFLFPPDLQYTTVGRLSGGERRRLYLLRILMEAPNVLLLDEPTNDLDIRTLMILEDYLDQFPGIVIAVSHDRYFLDRVVRRIFAFEENGRLRQYEGGYTDYEAALKKRQGIEETNLPSVSEGVQESNRASEGRKEGRKQNTRPRKLKFTYQEQRDFETIEEEIRLLEEAVSEKEAAIEEVASDYTALNQLMEEKRKLETTLEEKMERWMYLEELAEKIAAGETAG